MPRPKKAKTKVAKVSKVRVEAKVDGNVAESAPAAVAVAEPPAEALQPPTKPIETSEAEKAPAKGAPKANKDQVAPASVNIAKLQAMSMPELNQMARDLSVENFGTMRKHEVIFHILQKNAERAGILFSEGVLEVLPEGFGFGGVDQQNIGIPTHAELHRLAAADRNDFDINARFGAKHR